MNMISFVATTQLALKNIWRWRWRLLTIFILVAGSFALFVLYSGMLTVSSQIGVAQTVELNLPYDLMVMGDQNSPIIPESQLPTPKFRRPILKKAETGSSIIVKSETGQIELLGIEENSHFFKSDFLIEGNWLVDEDDIVLPSQMADQFDLSLGDEFYVYNILQDGVQVQYKFIISGFYQTDYDLDLPLIKTESAALIRQDAAPNRFFIQYNRAESELPHLVEWMRAAYPDAVLIYPTVTTDMGTALLQQIFQPGRWLLVLIFMFMGIGVLTVAFITFLERRRELAIMKSIGVSNGQIVYALGLEQGSAGLIGVIAGMIIVMLLGQRISWFSAIPSSELAKFVLQGSFYTLAVMIAAISFPTILAKVATVNQLLFARNIPIVRTDIDHLAKPTGWILMREDKENLRFLKFDVVDGRIEGILLKEVGDRVKEGEVVATQEMYLGLRYHEWRSPCDGEVVEYNRDSGHMAIKPDDPEAGRYPYPAHILQDEIRHQKNLEQGRRRARLENSVQTSK